MPQHAVGGWARPPRLTLRAWRFRASSGHRGKFVDDLDGGKQGFARVVACPESARQNVVPVLLAQLVELLPAARQVHAQDLGGEARAGRPKVGAGEVEADELRGSGPPGSLLVSTVGVMLE